LQRQANEVRTMTLTPGVYFEQVDRGRPAIGPLRTDIAGFVGYTERGPLLAPVKVSSWRQFTAAFGEPLADGYLAEALRGFFANGGAACYVTRIASQTGANDARTAAVRLVDSATAALPPANQQVALELWASHGTLLDPVTQEPHVIDGRPVRYDSPGAWGNRLAVSLYPAGLGSTTTSPGVTQPADGSLSLVDSLSGFEAGSIVRLSQAGFVAAVLRRVERIDPYQLALVWNQPLTGLGLDLTAPIRLESVEFTLLVLLDSQVVEQHRDLSLSAAHSRYAVRVLQSASHYLDAAVAVDTDAMLDPGRWPAAVERLPLTGGQDGLAGVRPADFLAGLDALARVDEVSLLAAPDVVLVAVPPPPTPGRTLPPQCADIHPPQGRLLGQVVELSEAGAILLTGVTVEAVNTSATPVVTAGDGSFTLQNLPLGLVTLRLHKDGYHPLETTVEARLNPPAQPIQFQLAPVSLPPAFSLDEIFDIQGAMTRQGEARLYRVALLDPPQGVVSLEKIQTWRRRFDSGYAALYYPWLQVQTDGPGLRDIPPSGHVAGLIARTDLRQGVHRAPANFVVDGVKGLTTAVDDVQQGILNPLGINCLRVLPGRGIRVFGARTLSSDPEWRYLNVRRLLLMIEEAIEDANQWAVFEPNNEILRHALTYSLSSFLLGLWQRGALAGSTPAAAFAVKCDNDNNPPGVVNSGQVVAEIGVAPTVPFEFITFRLGRTVDAVQITE
jgi:hypothetical protein